MYYPQFIFYCLLNTYSLSGKNEELQKFALIALNYLPHEPGLHFIYANCLGKLGQYIIAEKHFKAAISIKSDPLYYSNLGNLK